MSAEPKVLSDESVGRAEFEVKVPAGKVFLACDRGEVARDSRSFLSSDNGALPVTLIERRAVTVLSPSGAEGRLSDAPIAHYYLTIIVTALGLVVLAISCAVLLRRRSANPDVG